MMGQAYTSSPIIFIVYNYLVIPSWGGGGKQNQQAYLSAYTESKL